MSKIKWMEIENNSEVTTITPLNITIKGSVYEHIRRSNAEAIESEMILEKFKESAKFVDIKAQKQFKYTRCSAGHQYMGKRYIIKEILLINSYFLRCY